MAKAQQDKSSKTLDIKLNRILTGNYQSKDFIIAGSESYYVSFDNTAVGRLQGEGIKSCLDAAGKSKARIVYLNGSPQWFTSIFHFDGLS